MNKRVYLNFFSILKKKRKIKNVVLEGINEENNTFENIGKGILNFGTNFGKIFGWEAGGYKKPEHGYGFRVK